MALIFGYMEWVGNNWFGLGIDFLALKLRHSSVMFWFIAVNNWFGLYLYLNFLALCPIFERELAMAGLAFLSLILSTSRLLR